MLFNSSSCLFMSFHSCFFTPWKWGEGAFGNILRTHEYKLKTKKSTCILTTEYHNATASQTTLFLEVGVGSHRSYGVGNTHFLASLNDGNIITISPFLYFIFIYLILHYVHFTMNLLNKDYVNISFIKGKKILSHKNMFHVI